VAGRRGLNDWELTREIRPLLSASKIPGRPRASTSYLPGFCARPIGYLASLKNFLDKKGPGLRQVPARPESGSRFHFIARAHQSTSHTPVSGGDAQVSATARCRTTCTCTASLQLLRREDVEVAPAFSVTAQRLHRLWPEHPSGWRFYSRGQAPATPRRRGLDFKTRTNFLAA